MALSSRLRVTIEFSNAAWPLPELETQPGTELEPQLDDWPPYGMDVRLVQSEIGGQQRFTLYRGRDKAYTLTPKEAEPLLHKLARMEVPAPWRSQFGFDGTDYELTLRNAASSMTFRWWGAVPPEWELVGDVFEHVQHLARIRRRPD